MTKQEMIAQIEAARNKVNAQRKDAVDMLKLQAQLKALNNDELQQKKIDMEVRQESLEKVRAVTAMVTQTVEEMRLLTANKKPLLFRAYPVSTRYGKAFEELSALLSGLASLRNDALSEVLPMTGISDVLLSEITVALPKAPYYSIDQSSIQEGHRGSVAKLVKLLPHVTSALEIEYLELDTEVPQSLFDTIYDNGMTKAEADQEENRLAHAKWEADEEDDLTIDLS